MKDQLCFILFSSGWRLSDHRLTPCFGCEDVQGTYFFVCVGWMTQFRHQQYIGRVKHAVFQTQGAGRKRVVVATEENAIASLNLRTGDICTLSSYLLLP